MPRISVIIPVYNSAEFLRNTLQNIVAEQFGSLPANEWEIIAVNDGSTDNSLEILSEVVATCPNIKIINKSNSGAADSRNVGLEIAIGEYVYFCDSDDLILKNALAEIMAFTESTNCDIIKFNVKHISTAQYLQIKGNLQDALICVEDIRELTVANYLDITQAMTCPIGDCTWLTIYRRSFLMENNLKFNPDIVIGEDVDLIWRAMFCAGKVIYIPRKLYLYHLRSDSVSRNEKEFPLQAYSDLLDNMLHIRKQYSCRPDLVSSGADMGLRNTIRYLTNLVLSHKILRGTSLRNLYNYMRELKANGADIHLGRPRFDQSVKKSANRTAHLRRWVTSYILALLIWLCHE